MSENGSKTEAIIRFLKEVGLDVREGVVRDGAFLPGIDIVDGRLVVELPKLEYPTDLLHEAGHLAVLTQGERSRTDGQIEVPDSDIVEAAAIAWSYAASVRLGIDIRDLFHEGGYLGRSTELITMYSLGVYIGASELEARGMTQLGGDDLGSPRYPAMRLWLNS